MLQLYTYQLCHTQELNSLNIRLLNTTVMSGDHNFAPTWDMLNKYKAGSLSSQLYTEQYLKLMNERFQQDASIYTNVLQHETLALGCYCRYGLFCHRHLLKDWLIEKAEELGYEVYYEGELDGQ